MATIIPGEASETDDDNDDNDGDNNDCNDYNGSNMRQADNSEQNDEEMRKWNLNKTQQNLWGLHVDEKLEERWRSFGYDTVKLIERQALMQRKQFENLKQNLSNTQHALQAVSSTFRQTAENLGRVEWNLSLLQEGAKLIPNFSVFLTNSNCSTTRNK